MISIALVTFLQQDKTKTLHVIKSNAKKMLPCFSAFVNVKKTLFSIDLSNFLILCFGQWLSCPLRY